MCPNCVEEEKKPVIYWGPRATVAVSWVCPAPPWTHVHTQGREAGSCPNCEMYPALLLVGTELISFLAAGVMPEFGFMMKTVKWKHTNVVIVAEQCLHRARDSSASDTAGTGWDRWRQMIQRDILYYMMSSAMKGEEKDGGRSIWNYGVCLPH